MLWSNNTIPFKSSVWRSLLSSHWKLWQKNWINMRSLRNSKSHSYHSSTNFYMLVMVDIYIRFHTDRIETEKLISESFLLIRDRGCLNSLFYSINYEILVNGKFYCCRIPMKKFVLKSSNVFFENFKKIMHYNEFEKF